MAALIAKIRTSLMLTIIELWQIFHAEYLGTSMIHSCTKFLILSPGDSWIIFNKISLGNSICHFQTKSFLFVSLFCEKKCATEILRKICNYRLPLLVCYPIQAGDPQSKVSASCTLQLESHLCSRYHILFLELSVCSSGLNRLGIEAT
jgi:hypothetical protein